MQQEIYNKQFNAMKLVLITGIGVMVIKFSAYFLTHSTAILTDALESIINIVAGFFALYSIKLASKPKDKEHPYGHGKIEFISAGFEGGLIFIAAIAIIVKSIDNLLHPKQIYDLDIGIILSVVGGLINFVLGKYIIGVGKKNNSITLVADGKHLISDTLTSAGLILGLIVITITGLVWLDAVIAILFGVMILITGYQLIRKSLAGLMDEADENSLSNVIQVLNNNRSKKWIDIHNLRVLRYGANLHIDCHITLPWYQDLQVSHDELKAIENLVYEEFKQGVEIFIHPDPCLPISCGICMIDTCKHRQHPFQKQIKWELSNLLSDKKHQLSVDTVE